MTILFLNPACIVDDRGEIDPAVAARLKTVIGVTHARIVLVNSYGSDRKARAMCSAGLMNCAHEHYRTKCLPSDWTTPAQYVQAQRGHEISEWMSRHTAEGTRFAILDDSAAYLREQLPFLAITQVGLSDGHAVRLIETLTQLEHVALPETALPEADLAA